MTRLGGPRGDGFGFAHCVCARAIFVDTIAGHVLRPRIDPSIPIVAVAPAKERAVAIAVAVADAPKQRQCDLAGGSPALEGGRDLRMRPEIDGSLVGKPE